MKAGEIKKMSRELLKKKIISLEKALATSAILISDLSGNCPAFTSGYEDFYDSKRCKGCTVKEQAPKCWKYVLYNISKNEIKPR
jgi:hypothetical protein